MFCSLFVFLRYKGKSAKGKSTWGSGVQGRPGTSFQGFCSLGRHTGCANLPQQRVMTTQMKCHQPGNLIRLSARVFIGG